MELRVLKYYLTIASEENITKASRILHISQPTLSRQIMQLEEELGVKLFTRSNHKIILTADGKLFKQRAEEIITLSEKAKRDFTRDENNLTGEITIGSGELFSFNYLAEILQAFRQEYPLIRYDIYSGNADQVKDRMESGLIDIGLLLEPVDIGKYEFARIPGQEIWGLLVRRDSELASKSEVCSDDLTNLPILIAKRAILQNALSSWAGSNFEHLNIVATYNLINNAAFMVQKNIGVALCLKRCNLFEDLCFIPLKPELTAQSVLVWKKDHLFSPATKAFLTFAKKYLLSISIDTK
ncbi:MAG: LysR family transcriptional regulator [Deltaproteobacteria bacterium]|jgi:DNA-binding transcriptional LysR family regulator|nr:LysR family transcriptional regulator [Deltaproteobacteria bacterium]